jgi:CRP-like cAMP-binding protein
VIFLEAPHAVTAQALADSRLLFLPKAVVFEQIESTPQFARRMLGSLSRRLRDLCLRLGADDPDCAASIRRAGLAGGLLLFRRIHAPERPKAA